MKIEIIRTNGTVENHEGAFEDIGGLIGAEYLDTVNLRDGRVMCVDDNGYETKTVERRDDSIAFGSPAFVLELVPTKARKPVNPKASELYEAVSFKGNPHKIVGDVALVADADLGDDDEDDWYAEQNRDYNRDIADSLRRNR